MGFHWNRTAEKDSAMTSMNGALRPQGGESWRDSIVVFVSVVLLIAALLYAWVM